MRWMSWILALFLVPLASVAQAQELELPPPDRYGVAANLKLYPQSNPREALATASKLLDSRKYDYLVAHILDPVVIDTRIAERTRQLELAVDREFQQMRADQRRNLDLVDKNERLPVDPVEFTQKVHAEAERRAFKLVLKDIQENLSEYPEYVRLFRRYARDGVELDAGGTVSYSLSDVPGKKVFMKREGKRWHLEDRQEEAPKPTPKGGM